MRHAIISAALLAASVNAQADFYGAEAQKDAKIVSAAKFVEGVALGAFHDHKITGLEQCITDVEPLYADLEHAAEDFKAGGIKNMIHGLEEIGHTFHDIANSLKGCEHVTDEDKKALHEMAEVFKHPLKLSIEMGKHLIINGVDILKELFHGFKSLKAHEFMNAGQNLGEAAALVVYGRLTMDFNGESEAAFNNGFGWGVSKKDMAKFAQGLAQGAIYTALPDVSSCISDVTGTVSKIREAVGDFKQGGERQILEGVKAAAEAVEMVVDDIRDCQKIQGSVMKLVELAKSFSSPKSFIVHIGKDILHNGKDIYGEIMDSVTQWKSGNYYALGKDIGTALEKTFIGNEAEDIFISEPLFTGFSQ